MLELQEIQAIGRGDWRLDAPRIRLRCRRWGRTLRGAGCLEMGPNGMILRFYPAPELQFDAFNHAMSFPPMGEITDDQWYARGVLEDWRGRRWQISRFRPSFDVGPSSFVLRGTPLWLRCRRRSDLPDDGHSGQLYFFPTLTFPASAHTNFQLSMAGNRLRAGSKLNAATVESDQLTIRFLAEDVGECQVRSVRGPLPKQWSVRICEALQFVTARWHEWTIMTERRGAWETVIIRPPCGPEPSQVPRPIHSASPAIAAKGWTMFSDYLRFVWSDPEPALHNVSGAVRSVIRASTASVEATAIQLGVSIERLTRTEFPELWGHQLLDESQLRSAIKAVEASGLDEHVCRRVTGAIQALRNPRPHEVLEELALSGRVRKQLVRVFGRLRNPAVHGGTAENDLQEWLDRRSAGVALFYELVFARIGYRGPYTDHTKHDMPIIEYPPTEDQANG